MTATSLFPLPLLALLGFTALAPAAALANPNGVYQRYGYESYGPYGAPGLPLLAAPQAQPAPARTCNAGTVLTGAVLGGGLSAALANGPRNRRWALPMGAAVGGILGGVVSGC